MRTCLLFYGIPSVLTKLKKKKKQNAVELKRV
jgi:hypothetical protein